MQRFALHILKVRVVCVVKVVMVVWGVKVVRVIIRVVSKPPYSPM